MANKKLWIDIALFADLIVTFAVGLYFVNVDMSLRNVHIALGALFFVLLIFHFAVNGRDWFVAGLHLFRGEKYGKIRWVYVLDWLLLIAWAVVLTTGVAHLAQSGGHMMGGGPGMGLHMGGGMHEGGMHQGGMMPGNENSMLLVRNLHFAFSIIGTGLVAIHIIQHLAQIRAYFKNLKGKRPNAPEG